MFGRAVRGRGANARRCAAWALGAVALAGCGGASRQDAGEPGGTFPLEVSEASFPARQGLSEHTEMVIAVRNVGKETAPDVAVTVENPREGTGAEAFGERAPQAGLADSSRPTWIVDQGPVNGTTAYANTWALGPMFPGETKTFRWKLTAVRPGEHELRYVVAAALNGKAKARGAGGRSLSGLFSVSIARKPAPATVGANGEVVRSR